MVPLILTMPSLCLKEQLKQSNDVAMRHITFRIMFYIFSPKAQSFDLMSSLLFHMFIKAFFNL